MPYIEESNERLDRDLEVLEILKRYLVVETMDDNEREWEQINCYLTLGKLPMNCEDEVAFNKVKEWLER